MADYKAIKGWTIQTVSSDPSNLIAGQVWYNSTLGKIKAAGSPNEIIKDSVAKSAYFGDEFKIN